jgi:S-(hydroxymethyl)glutathione dehydrogenase/alcohol dehydrogenase
LTEDKGRFRFVRAALLQHPGRDFAIVDDVALEPPRPGEVIVAVEHCGVCHSDLHVADGSIPCPLPVILGHEAAGRVAEIGPGVDHLHVGQPVLLSPRPPCGRCYFCRRGEWSLCATSSGLMMGSFPDGSTRLRHGERVVYRGIGLGAFAEAVVVPASGAIPLPADVPLDIACVLGCAVQTGVGAVLNTARVEPGATVLVVGLGGVGLSIVMGAQLAAAARIIAVDRVASRRARAADFGATDVIDPEGVDLMTAVLGLTDGIGADYAFDAVGRTSLVESCVLATRDGGTTVMVGIPSLTERIDLPGLMMAASEKKLMGCFLGSCNPARDVPFLLGQWRVGRLNLAGMVTARRPLVQLDRAFADLAAGEGLRTVIDM